MISAIFSGLLVPLFDTDFASATSDEGGDTGGGDDGGGDNGGGGGDEPEPEPEPDPEPEPEPEPGAPGLAPGPEPPVDPCIENPNSEGCGPTPPSTPPIPPTPPTPPPANLITPSPRVSEPPDYDCLYDPSLPKCAPIAGKCPPGFLMNEAGQCYPDKPCPPGYARADNDESGACLPLPPTTPPPGGNCHPSYPNNCIPPPPPNRNCGDPLIPNNVKVVPPDPHQLDKDKDGIGCEGGGGNGGDGRGNGNNGGGSTSTTECQGQADCFRGTVTEIVDGDTLDINNVRVRLALVNTPERGQSGYTEAIDFVQLVCGVGTTALVDEDDGQKEGSFERVIGLIYCGNDNINNKKSLNELLLERGYAVIYQDFCGISEFASESWAQSRGC